MFFAVEQDRDEPNWGAILAAKNIRQRMYRHLRGHIFLKKTHRDQYVVDFADHPDYQVWAITGSRARIMFRTIDSDRIFRHYPERYRLIEPDWIKK